MRDRFRKQKFRPPLFYYSRSPSLHLKGHWLGEAGFETGCLVKVHIEPGRIMICPV
ncbi:type I toxin-antitoxin system SymE family toxin [Enterobacteriaceae bacterium BIT-l23]|uniref:SymE family type I addiction module toxin n=1 Tax=Jejubacter sp. L23 TaxID=3092086 RepID=UPI0015849F53|nr:type I toxin-antitoxin system SymE family toxin [Enterobacteriaceae bacterium BIT-l23]